MILIEIDKKGKGEYFLLDKMTQVKQTLNLQPMDVSSQLENLHVLVVDDDLVYRKLLTELLQKLKFKVTAVEGGQQALQKLKEQSLKTSKSSEGFSIILVDCMMPNMDGFELLRFMKKAYSLDIPTIMISSSKDPDIISKAFESGVEDFLQKPIRLEMLKTRISMCLEDRLRRIKEKELENQLIEQRKKNIEHQKIIATFKSEISEKIETPIQAVMKTIGELMKQDDNSSIQQYKGTLIAILKSLGSHDLYKPAFEEIEASTKKWLETEYTTFEKTKNLSNYQTMVETKTENLKEMNDISTWDFNVCQYKETELIKALNFMFKDLGFLQTFKVDEKKFNSWLKEVRNHYNDNDYHNFVHCVDVTQFVYMCLKMDKVKDYLTPLEKFALFISAICHDIDHPGLNNNFQINAQTPLTILYNDISVLENHHCALSFKILKNKSIDILEGLSVEDWNAFRKYFIANILATDMTHHFELQTKLQTRLKTGPMTSDQKDRQQLASMILKCADISNVMRPFEVSQKLASGLVNEFCNQGDIEKARQLPLSPLMDRDSMNKPKLQVNFIDYIAAPLFKSVSGYLTEMEVLNERILSNRTKWSELLAKEEKKEEKKEDKKEENNVRWIYGDLEGNLLAKIKGFNVLIICEDVNGKAELLNCVQTRGYTIKVISFEESQVLEQSQGDFDVIIIQLKDQSTFDLTNKISKVIKRKIPIIGITKEDKEMIEKCKSFKLEYLTRPIEIKTFLTTLDHFVSISQETAPVIDVKLANEQSGDDLTFLIELIELFIDEGKKQLQSMESFLEKDDVEGLENEAHSMKGASAQIAAKPLSRACFLLEDASKRKDSSKFKEYFELIKKRFNDFHQKAIQLVKNYTK